MRRFQYAVSGTWLKSMQISPTITVSTRVICTQSGSSWFLGQVNTRHYLFDVLPLKRHTSWVCFYHPEGVTVYLRWQFTTWYYRSSKCMWFASRVWQFGVMITLLTPFGVLAVFFPLGATCAIPSFELSSSHTSLGVLILVLFLASW